MTPEGDFLGSNPVSVTISRARTSSSPRKFPARNPLGSKRSGKLFDDHGKKRKDPGNDVATMHPDFIKTSTSHRANTMAISDDYDVIAQKGL